jgi:hypothetical protein
MKLDDLKFKIVKCRIAQKKALKEEYKNNSSILLFFYKKEKEYMRAYKIIRSNIMIKNKMELI